MSDPRVNPVPAKRASAAARYHITSYEQGRVCEAVGCRTTLSQYNQHPLCWRHAEARARAAVRDQRF